MPVAIVLGQAEDQPRADPLDLPPHMDHSGVQVHIIGRQAEDLALTQAATGAEVHHQSVPLRDRPADRGHLFASPRNDAPFSGPRLPHRARCAWVLDDLLVIDSRAEDGA
ncbi:hypothetical protein Asera_37120 [Actinocatenispora sera]|uniref:Uncharacterized protein n=1 Tax=Actinocatenispora sera TaxID=390989 RepID=A0A810L2D2_9ACTN|nr:hypothetical protein Asera_37120 [Actinocatenispora sera]